MFGEFLKFELKQGIRRPSFWIFLSLLFAFGLFWGLFQAGILGSDSRESNAYVNSAYASTVFFLVANASIFGLFNSLMIISLMADTVARDYQYNTHSLFYTKPITKPGYFFGRFFGGYFFTLLIFLAQLIGFIIGVQAGAGKPQVGPFSIMNFIQPFIVFVMPNVLFQGVIYFSLNTFTRNQMFSYAFAVVLFVARSIADAMESDMDYKTLSALLEPTGANAFGSVTEYWTPIEQNNLMIPLNGAVLHNRLLWGGLAVVITFLCYFRFSFSQFLQPVSLFARRKSKEVASAIVIKIDSIRHLPKVARSFDLKSKFTQIIFLAQFEFSRIIRSVFFLVAVGLGLFYLFLVPSFTSQIYGDATYPVTHMMIEAASGLMQLMILLLALFSTGTMMWRERESKVDELVGSTPVSNAVLFWSKFAGMMMIEIVMLFIIMIGSIGYQLSHGFTDIDLPQYLSTLMGMRLIYFAVITAFFMAIQTFFSNKFIGNAVGFVFLLVIPIVFGLLEWRNPLYILNSDGPELAYSDLNSFGHYPFIFILFKVYWFSAILVLAIFGIRCYGRGKEKSLKSRFRLSKYSLNRKAMFTMSGSLAVFFVSGGFIFYNIKVINKINSSEQMEKLAFDFEKKFKHFERSPQPRIIASNVNIDIYPEKRGAEMNGYFWLKNKTEKNIDTILVNEIAEIEVKTMEFSRPFKKVAEEKDYGMHIFRMEKPLVPGDSVKLTYSLNYFPKGFKADDPGTEILYNGTFFNSMMLPSIGYNEGKEISNNKTRKKYGLHEKPRMKTVSDTNSWGNTYISHDADWIDFECVVSTSSDQTAIAPGYLQKTWEKDGRKYFHYKMDCKILNFYAFLSARYDIVRDQWVNPLDPNNKVNIEIYYHKVHDYNLDRMIKGIKLSLDYYTKNFSPYQHKQVRIIEFPRYASFAQSFPNTIPFSESIGFVLKVDKDDPEAIDMPLYVTSHEVAHQWWAHQVIGADVQGATLMSETMSQYSALMVMEKEYGHESMKRFLKYEMDKYLIGRTLESRKELPIMYAENQQYIHYNKGSVLMYALKDYIGEDSLNAALRKYISKVGYQEPPYTTSVEFVEYLKQATPDSLKYIITDMFETITLYNNSVKEMKVTEAGGGKYKVTFKVGSVKYRADSVGKEVEIPVADWMDIGVFGEEEINGKKRDKKLLFKKFKITGKEQTFEFLVNEKPVKVGIDPYNKLIDRTPENNTLKVGQAPIPDKSGGFGGIVVQVGEEE